jgi:YspA, cpYpsA-related SLOG family
VRILLTGSRTWTDPMRIWAALDIQVRSAANRGENLTLVHGACPRGADHIADDWAEERAATGWPIHVERHPADWNSYAGKSAGHRRNAEMVNLGADLCLAFVRDNSPGTTGCIRLAEGAGIRVLRFDWNEA